MDLVELGSRIQDARRERGLTLQALAGRARVSAGMLSSVERGRKAPTIVVLDRIAAGLRMPVTALIAPAEAARVIVRRAAGQDVVDEPGGWQRVILTPVVPGVNFEWIQVTLPPHCDAGEYPVWAPGSHEFIAVQAGTLRFSLGGQSFDLGAGDSLYFAPDAPHRYQNPAGEPCTYYVAALIMRPRTPRP